MANKFDGDVRPLSNDKRYMGVVFSGSMANAIRQAKAAKDHGLPELSYSAHVLQVLNRLNKRHISRDRIALLQHLNLVSL